MLKGNQTSLRGPKMVSGTSASSHPGCLHQFKIKSSTSEVNSESALEPRSSLLNGLITSLPETSAKETHRNDISNDFGLFQSTKQKTHRCSNTNMRVVFEEDRESETKRPDCAEEDECKRSLTQRQTDNENDSKSEEREETEPALSKTRDQICSLSPTDTNVKAS